MARRHLIIAAFTAALFLLCAAPPVYGAELLVGPGTITANSLLVPGRSYVLPAHKVTNNSLNALKMAVSVSEHRDGARELPPAEWFSIDREELIVQARSTEEVQVEVHLPGDAPAGKYKVWFLFDAMSIGGEGLVTAAAIQVSFTFEIMDVGQSAAPAENAPGGRAGGGISPFLRAGAAAVLVAALMLGGRSAYRFAQVLGPR